MYLLSKANLSLLAIVLTIVIFVPYIKGILQGHIKPHYFSWLVWGITTSIVFFAQVADNAGAGAWPTGLSAIITFGIAWLAYRNSHAEDITKTDQAFLITSLATVPLWYLVSDPLWTVIILTIVDLLGFGPTLRKAHQQPYSEDILFYSLCVIRNSVCIAALEHYSTTTLLFLLATGIACAGLVVLIIVRRYMLKHARP